MPSIPEKPIIREKIKGGSIDLKWDLPNNQLRDHLLFIIEHRWNVGYAPSESHMTSWQQVLQVRVTCDRKLSIIYQYVPLYVLKLYLTHPDCTSTAQSIATNIPQTERQRLRGDWFFKIPEVFFNLPLEIGPNDQGFPYKAAVRATIYHLLDFL